MPCMLTTLALCQQRCSASPASRFWVLGAEKAASFQRLHTLVVNHDEMPASSTLPQH